MAANGPAPSIAVWQTITASWRMALVVITQRPAIFGATFLALTAIEILDILTFGEISLGLSFLVIFLLFPSAMFTQAYILSGAQSPAGVVTARRLGFYAFEFLRATLALAVPFIVVVPLAALARVAAGITVGMWIVAIFLATPRVSMLFPARVLDRPLSYRGVFDFTRGRTLAMAAAFWAGALPLIILNIAVGQLMEQTSLNFVLISVTIGLLAATIVACAQALLYLQLAAGNAPPPPAAPP